MEGGSHLVAELVSNPDRQKGGNAVRRKATGQDVLLETPNTQGSPVLSDLIDRLARIGAPYNRFRLIYRISGIRPVIAEGLGTNVRYKDGFFTVELVTGDLTQSEKSHAVFFQKSPEEVIHDFKGFGNLPEALGFAARQESLLSSRVDG